MPWRNPSSEVLALTWEEALERSKARVGQLTEICRRRGRVLVLMQDNPDPDALASAMALRELILRRCGKRATIGYGGICGRAENQAMMEVLHIRARHMTPAQVRQFRIVCLVDTQPRTGNNILTREPNIVIDHHLLPKRNAWSAEFADVRPDYGATSTILYEYLTSAGIRLSRDLATALFYGIQSDTQDLGREAGPLSLRAYQELFLRADKKKLARIRRAPVPASYFKMLADSLSECVVAGKTVISQIPDCENPDMVAEVADLLLRLKGAHTTVCYGVCGDKIHVSARAVDARDNMARRMKQAVRHLGTGGGHRTMAGGQVPAENEPERRLAQVRERILRAFAGKHEARPLVPAPDAERIA